MSAITTIVYTSRGRCINVSNETFRTCDANLTDVKGNVSGRAAGAAAVTSTVTSALMMTTDTELFTTFTIRYLTSISGKKNYSLGSGKRQWNIIVQGRKKAMEYFKRR